MVSNRLVGICLFLICAVSSAKVISMGVGQVRDHVVTSREVQINQGLEQVLTAERPNQIRILTDVESSEFPRQVTAVLLEWVVYFEAVNMAVSQISASEVSAVEEKVKTILSKVSAWRDLDATSREIQSAITRKLQAKKFIRFRADSSVVPVTEAEALHYFEQNRLKFGNSPFENFRSGIKTILAKQQVEGRLKDWFEILQSKYQVHNFLSEK